MKETILHKYVGNNILNTSNYVWMTKIDTEHRIDLLWNFGLSKKWKHILVKNYHTFSLLFLTIHCTCKIILTKLFQQQYGMIISMRNLGIRMQLKRNECNKS